MADISTVQLLMAIVAGSMPSAIMLLTVMLYLDRKLSRDIKDLDTRQSRDIKALVVSVNNMERQQSAMQATLDLIVYGNELPPPVARRRAQEAEAISEVE